MNKLIYMELIIDNVIIVIYMYMYNSFTPIFYLPKYLDSKTAQTTYKIQMIIFTWDQKLMN